MKKIRFSLFLFFIPLFAFTQIPNAVGDGITDDTAAIQAWANSGFTGTPWGDETYRISRTINVTGSADVDIDANGAQFTTI